MKKTNQRATVLVPGIPAALSVPPADGDLAQVQVAAGVHQLQLLDAAAQTRQSHHVVVLRDATNILLESAFMRFASPLAMPVLCKEWSTFSHTEKSALI